MCDVQEIVSDAASGLRSLDRQVVAKRRPVAAGSTSGEAEGCNDATATAGNESTRVRTLRVSR